MKGYAIGSPLWPICIDEIPHNCLDAWMATASITSLPLLDNLAIVDEMEFLDITRAMALAFT